MCLKRQTRLFLAILSGTLAIAGIAFLCLHLFMGVRGKELVRVKEECDLAYLVYQKNNPFVQDSYLSQDMNYLHTYTDYIYAENSYSAAISSVFPVDYSYRVVATLISRYNKTAGGQDNPEIMQKQYLLESHEGNSVTGAIFATSEHRIRLEEYLIDAAAFAATVQLPVTSEVRIDFFIDLSSDVFESSFVRSMTIPISTEFYNITLGGDENGVREYNLPLRPMNLWSQIALVALIAICFWYFLLLLRKLSSNKSLFRQTIDDRLRTYDDIIISAETTIDFAHYENIRINDFKELVQLALKLNLPILFAEQKHSARFYVTNENIVYLFEMEETDPPLSLPSSV